MFPFIWVDYIYFSLCIDVRRYLGLDEVQYFRIWKICHGYPRFIEIAPSLKLFNLHQQVKLGGLKQGSKFRRGYLNMKISFEIPSFYEYIDAVYQDRI